MTTGIEGITAPRHPATVVIDGAGQHAAAAGDARDDDYHPRSLDDGEPVEDFAAQAGREGTGFTASRRQDGWTADRQRAFLDYIAQGLVVSDAATLCGMSAASAYAFRKRAAGAAFAVGWQAALLLQRNRLVDDLTSRAFRGQTETLVRPDGSTVERHRYDNRLGLALLTRLDKIAAADLPDRTGDARAARLAAQDWDRYLDLIGADASPAQAGMFLALRVTEGEAQAIAPIAALARADLYQRTGVGCAAEVDIRDLDPARRGAWTADQWTRAEAAGLVSLAPPIQPDVSADPGAADPAATPAETAHGNPQFSQHWPDLAPDPDPDAGVDADDDGPDDDLVWWCYRSEGWRTRFPPPADFDGDEDGDYGDDFYERELTEDEVAAVLAPLQREADRRRPAETARRDAYFARLLTGKAPVDPPGDPATGEDDDGAEEDADDAGSAVRRALAPPDAGADPGP